MVTKGFISEIFSSVQGEGVYVGCYQLFIRLSGCVFDCPYCDTDFTEKESFTLGGAEYVNPILPDNLADIIVNEYGDMAEYHSVSVTGGEPLLQPLFVEAFVKLLKPRIKAKIFVETSGLVVDEFDRLDGLVDIFSVDIKMHDSISIDNLSKLLEKLKELQFSSYYLKLLLADDVNFAELDTVISKLSKEKIPTIIIQPIDNIISDRTIFKVMEKFSKHKIAVRIIPQLHKLLNIR